MNRFRPQEIPKAFIFKQRLATGRSENYNWQSRVKWIPAGYKSNRRGILRRWQEIHHSLTTFQEPDGRRLVLAAHTSL